MHRRADVGSGDDSHKFWDKQPVPKLAESSTDNEPIEIKTVDDVRKKPYKLPTGYSWSVVDVNKPEQVRPTIACDWFSRLTSLTYDGCSTILLAALNRS